MAAFQIPSVFTAVDRLTRPVRRMGKGIVRNFRTAKNVVTRVDRAFFSLGRTINTVAGGFGLFLGGAALFAVLSSGIGIIADYEQANANLASVLGINIEQTSSLQKASQLLGATTAFTASEVSGLQTEYAKLGFQVPQILNMTEATLALAAATRTELPQAALQVGSAIKAFGLASTDAARVSDVFASATSKSALNMEILNVSMSKVAPISKQFGFSIENTVAFMAKLADAGFEASTIATSTRSIFLNLADANGKLAKALGGPARNMNEVTGAMIQMRKKGLDLSKMLGLTDKRSVAAFATFLDQAEGIRTMNKAMEQARGTAKLMALKQLDTLTGSLTKVKSAYQGFILSLEDGTGPFAKNLKMILAVITQLLAMAGGFDDVEAAEAAVTAGTNKVNKSLLTAAQQLKIAEDKAKKYAAQVKVVALQTLKWIKVIGALVAVFVAVKLAIFAVTTAVAAWAIAVKLASAAMIAFNFIMAANPIGLIIVAVAAFIALLAIIINKWDEWGAAVALFLGPIGLVISLIQSFRRNWELISKSFKTGGILSGIKSIALAIADGLLQPIEQLLSLVNKFTGIDLGVAAVSGLRQTISASLDNAAGVEGDATTVNPVATRERALIERSETVEEQRLKLLIESDKPVSIEENQTNGVEVQLPNTFNFTN